jgi:hypothetical protein
MWQLYKPDGPTYPLDYYIKVIARIVSNAFTIYDDYLNDVGIGLYQVSSYFNHSCNPNLLYNTATMELECLRTILVGDEFTFFYPATEWKMSQKFECQCGEIDCIGLVQGAADTPVEILKKYKLTSFIQSNLK